MSEMNVMNDEIPEDHPEVTLPSLSRRGKMVKYAIFACTALALIASIASLLN